MSLTLITTTG